MTTTIKIDISPFKITDTKFYKVIGYAHVEINNELIVLVSIKDLFEADTATKLKALLAYVITKEYSNKKE